MVQTKRDIARWALRGISVLGVVFGVGLVCFSFAVAFSLPRDDFAVFCFRLAFLGVLAGVGVFLVRDSARMFRGRTFQAARTIAVLPTLICFGLVAPWVEPLTVVSAQGRWGQFAEDLIGVATLLTLVLIYFAFLKLIGRLAEAAYGPAEPSGTPDAAG